MRRSKVDQFRAVDDAGTLYTIIKFRTVQESQEIRSDRMSADPIFGEEFETLEGRGVHHVGEDTFQIYGTHIVVRKI